MAAGGAVPGRAVRGGGGRSVRPAHLLLRLDGRRRLEDARRRRDVEERLGRLLRDGLGRRARGGRVRPECPLRRHGRDDDSRQCRARRRRLQSTDAGATWTHCGLAETRHIARVRVHPRDPDLVYVAAFGHVCGPNAERGVYRSRRRRRDLGAASSSAASSAGAIDLAMDPNNPRILYAAFWEAQRTPYGLTSGGPGSGLFKSTDGGDTWTRIDATRPACRRGCSGKIGVACSAKSERVWALVEAEDGGLFRSDDGGATWEKMSDNARSAAAPVVLHAHHRRPDRARRRVWVPNVQLWKSTDGGRTFSEIPTPHGDNHDLWIDPHELAADDRGQRRRRVRLVQRRRGVVLDLQPADRRVLSRHDGQRRPLPPLRRAAGQHDDQRRPAAPTTARSPGRTATRSAAARAATSPCGPTTRTSSSPGSYWLVTRYDHRTHQSRNILALAGEPDGLERGRPQVPLPVDLPDPRLAARSRHALRHLATSSTARPTRARVGR